MEKLKEHHLIKEFMLNYPENIHDYCLLGLCVLGIDVIKTTKIDLLQYLSENLDFQMQHFQTKFQNLTETTKVHEKVEIVQNDSIPTNSSFTSLRETPEKLEKIQKKIIPENPRKVKKRTRNGSSVIEIVDNFLNTSLIREIYEKEMIAERLKIPFRKKWEDACNTARINSGAQ